jgi:hypothetical protein
MMDMVVPQILVSLAPPEELLVAPYSPFSKTAFLLPQHDDAFRPVHLTPPPLHTRFARKPLATTGESPSDDGSSVTGQGLDPARFEKMLASAKRGVDVRKDVDLRKEVALKAHRQRQVERRLLFLGKLFAPPSPSAATLPPSPPESPAVFHYRLPSPGLISPIAHYESLQEEETNEARSPWVEQVDFNIKLLAPPVKRRQCALQPKPKPASKQALPSLDQISARINNCRSIRVLDETGEAPAQPAPVQVIGRLRMPVRASKTMPTIAVTDESLPAAKPVALKALQVPRPVSPLKPAEPTPLVVPCIQSVSPTEVPRINLLALDSRKSRSSTMLSTLRRRTQSNVVCGLHLASPTELDLKRPAASRRHSAPPDSMPHRERTGFEHPILSIPGSF